MILMFIVIEKHNFKINLAQKYVCFKYKKNMEKIV